MQWARNGTSRVSSQARSGRHVSPDISNPALNFGSLRRDVAASRSDVNQQRLISYPRRTCKERDRARRGRRMARERGGFCIDSIASLRRGTYARIRTDSGRKSPASNFLRITESAVNVPSVKGPMAERRFRQCNWVVKRYTAADQSWPFERGDTIYT